MAGMKFAAIPRIPAWLPAMALVALVLVGFGLQRSPRICAGNQPAFDSLVHWRRAGHDWLVVADGKADEVVIYNAADGRLLKRMRISRGVSDASALVQRDGNLFVVGDDGRLGELKLSAQRIAAADSR